VHTNGPSSKKGIKSQEVDGFVPILKLRACRVRLLRMPMCHVRWRRYYLVLHVTDEDNTSRIRMETAENNIVAFFFNFMRFLKRRIGEPKG